MTDPYGDNPALEFLDITFTLIFAKPMEPSHVGIQTIDDTNNYDLKSSDILSLFEKRGLELAYCQIVSMNNIVYIQQLHSQNNNNSGSVSKVKSLRDQAVEKQKKEEIDAVNDLVSDLLSDD